jgi:D-alanine-D-alanine ligase
MGGCSSEREVSLKSGKAIFHALQELGCHVSAIDITTSDESVIQNKFKDSQLEVAFLALHGTFGEDGTIQGILDRAGIPYTGSGVAASRSAINKILTQKILQEAGIPVPPHLFLSQDEPRDWGKIMNSLGGLPLVVKPACEGSSIGITIVADESAGLDAINEAFRYGPQILIERYIAGRELTAAILEDQPLPLVEIKPKRPFFDFTAKYQKGMSDYIVPAALGRAITQRIQNLALQAFQAIGCRDFARVDFILDGEERPYVLEINTIPGFTATSLLPMAAQEAGYSFSDLCLKIIGLAWQRKVSPVL